MTMLALRHARDAAALVRGHDLSTAVTVRKTDAAPSCHSERSEESKASDHSALRSTHILLSVSTYSQWVSFVRMYM